MTFVHEVPRYWRGLVISTLYKVVSCKLSESSGVMSFYQSHFSVGFSSTAYVHYWKWRIKAKHGQHSNNNKRMTMNLKDCSFSFLDKIVLDCMLFLFADYRWMDQRMPTNPTLEARTPGVIQSRHFYCFSFCIWVFSQVGLWPYLK